MKKEEKKIIVMNLRWKKMLNALVNYGIQEYHKQGGNPEEVMDEDVDWDEVVGMIIVKNPNSKIKKRMADNGEEKEYSSVAATRMISRCIFAGALEIVGDSRRRVKKVRFSPNILTEFDFQVMKIPRISGCSVNPKNPEKKVTEKEVPKGYYCKADVENAINKNTFEIDENEEKILKLTGRNKVLGERNKKLNILWEAFDGMSDIIT